MEIGGTLQTRIQYRILEAMGKGGQATVYKAVRHSDARTPDQIVAIKFLNESSPEEDSGEALITEAKSLLDLKIPTVVHILGVEKFNGGRLGLVLEFIDGPNLESFSSQLQLEQRKAFFKALALDLFGALEFLHDRGWVHGDVSSKNILVSPNGVFKLGDFGLAGLQAQKNLHSSAGTPGYLSPRRLKDQQKSQLDDVFGAACVLLNFLSGSNVLKNTLGPDGCLDSSLVDNFVTNTDFWAQDQNIQEFFEYLFRGGANAKEARSRALEMLGPENRNWREFLGRTQNNKTHWTRTLLKIPTRLGEQSALSKTLYAMAVILALLGFPKSTSFSTQISDRFSEIQVNAAPWAEIWIDGKSYGITPQLVKNVKSGLRRIDLDYPERRETLFVQLYPGKRLQLVRGMVPQMVLRHQKRSNHLGIQVSQPLNRQLLPEKETYRP